MCQTAILHLSDVRYTVPMKNINHIVREAPTPSFLQLGQTVASLNVYDMHSTQNDSPQHGDGLASCKYVLFFEMYNVVSFANRVICATSHSYTQGNHYNYDFAEVSN